MAKVQAIMQDSIEKQTLKSLDRLADALETTTPEEENPMMMVQVDDNPVGKDATTDGVAEKQQQSKESEDSLFKGENKVMINKNCKRKQKHGYRMKAIVGDRKAAATAKKEKRKPRYHCAF